MLCIVQEAESFLQPNVIDSSRTFITSVCITRLLMHSQLQRTDWFYENLFYKGNNKERERKHLWSKLNKLCKIDFLWKVRFQFISAVWEPEYWQNKHHVRPMSVPPRCITMCQSSGPCMLCFEVFMNQWLFASSCCFPRSPKKRCKVKL